MASEQLTTRPAVLLWASRQGCGFYAATFPDSSVGVSMQAPLQTFRVVMVAPTTTESPCSACRCWPRPAAPKSKATGAPVSFMVLTDDQQQTI